MSDQQLSADSKHFDIRYSIPCGNIESEGCVDVLKLAEVSDRYERRYIERWLAQGNSRCPATGQRMTRPVTLTPNVALRKSMEEWAEKNAAWMLVSLHLPVH